MSPTAPLANSWQLLGSSYEAANQWDEAAAAYVCEFALREKESVDIAAQIAAEERQLRMLSRLKLDAQAELLGAVALGVC